MPGCQLGLGREPTGPSVSTFAMWRQLWEEALGPLDERCSNIQAFLDLPLGASPVTDNTAAVPPTSCWASPGSGGPSHSGAAALLGPLPGLPQEHPLALLGEEKPSGELWPSRSRPQVLSPASLQLAFSAKVDSRCRALGYTGLDTLSCY